MASNAENVSIWWRHHVPGKMHTACSLSCVLLRFGSDKFIYICQSKGIVTSKPYSCHNDNAATMNNTTELIYSLWTDGINATEQSKANMFACLVGYTLNHETYFVAQISYYQIHLKDLVIGFILVLLSAKSYSQQVWISNTFRLKDDSIKWNAKTVISIPLMLCITMVIHCMLFWKINLGFTLPFSDRTLASVWYQMTNGTVWQ